MSGRADNNGMAKHDSRPERVLVRSGAGIYAAAAVIVTIQAALPGGPRIALAPALAAILVAAATLVAGPHVSRRSLLVLSPLGTGLIAYGFVHGAGYSDAAILYSWPTLWVAYFYGTRATALTVAGIAVAHALALVSMPAGVGSIDRWLDVVVSATIIAAVVRVLVTRREHLVQQLTAEARKDPLTGLLNRRGFAERLDTEVLRARRLGHPLAAVAIDIDHFKAINDRHGHDAGDRVLARVAHTLRLESRATDIVARLGGDEFLVVLPDADADEARGYADRVRATLHADPHALEVSVSAGVSVAAGPTTAKELTASADRALYEAKRAGRNATAVSAG